MSLTRPFSESVLSARKASAALSGEASDYALPGLGKPPPYFISDQGGGWGSPSRDSASPSARFLLSMLTTVSMALWEPTNGQADGKASTVKLKQHPLKLSQRKKSRAEQRSAAGDRMANSKEVEVAEINKVSDPYTKGTVKAALVSEVKF